MPSILCFLVFGSSTDKNDLEISNIFLTWLLPGCESIAFSVQVGGATKYF